MATTNDTETATKAEELYLAMLRDNIPSPADRIGERITDSRLHKRLLMSLISFGHETRHHTGEPQALIAGWEASGILDSQDMRKVSIWKDQADKRARAAS